MTSEVLETRPDRNSIVVQIDHLTAEGVSGWAFYMIARSKRVNIEILVDGNVVGLVTADRFRSDLKESGVSDGCSGFRFEFPDACFDGRAHEITLRHAETGLAITRAPVTVTFPNAPSRKAIGLFEHLDTALFVSGWALVPEQSDKPITIDVLVDGVTAVSQNTHLLRPDLLAAGLGHGRNGFRINIPKNAITSLKHDITLLANGVPLDGGPKTLDLSGQVTLKITEIKDGNLHAILSGWPGASLAADVFVDGIPAGQLNLRSAKNKGDNICQGKWKIPEEFQGSNLHVFQTAILNNGKALRSDAVIQRSSSYNVYIEHADFQVIAGWALRHGSNRPLKIAAFLEGRLVGQAEAIIPRADVQSSYGLASERCGFEIVLSEDIHVSSAEFELRDQETGAVLADIDVACRYEALAALALGVARNKSQSNQGMARAILAPLVSQSKEDIAFAFTCLPRRRNSSKPRHIDVIIPVYGGPLETAECIESVLSSRNNTPSRIVVINDCSPDPLINNYLDALSQRACENLLIIHRTQNGGFSEAVNLGMIVAGDRDVILLNADTVVQDNWIDRLVAAAAQDSRIATVTPLSNNAEICTVPYMCRSLPVETTAIASSMDQAAARCNAGRLIDIPVAIGFCMYIRRESIDDIGLFDAATWGRGYGEEVDFCLKAVARGWRNVATTDTFVVHRGSVSFGDEKLMRIMESAKKINERYPFYDQMIQRFLAADPLRNARRSINMEMIAGILPKVRILHLTHGYGGGTEQYVRDMATMADAEGLAPIVLRFSSDGSAELTVDLGEETFGGLYERLHVERYGKNETESLRQNIEQLNIKRVHIHSPFGVSAAMLEWLISSHACDLTVHDYAWICPRVTLTGPDGRYCGEPSPDDCNVCVSLYGAHPGLKHFIDAADGDVVRYREPFARLLGGAETVFAGTKGVIARLTSHEIAANYKAVPHPAPEDSPFCNSSPVPIQTDSNVVTVAVIGAISDIKGFHHLVACAELAAKKRLPIQFMVFGYTMNNDALRHLTNITIVGQYEEDMLRDLVEEHRPTMAFFPNQSPETFSYTLSHAFRMGLWPVATDIGAPAERIRDVGFGTLLPLHASAEETLRTLLKVAAERKRQPVVPPVLHYPATLRAYAGFAEAASSHAPKRRRVYQRDGGAAKPDVPAGMRPHAEELATSATDDSGVLRTGQSTE